jgi:hypothetical protein
VSNSDRPSFVVRTPEEICCLHSDRKSWRKRYYAFVLLLVAAIATVIYVRADRWNDWPWIFLGFAALMSAVSVWVDYRGQLQFDSLIRANMAAAKSTRSEDPRGVASAGKKFEACAAQVAACRGVQVVCLVVGFASFAAWAVFELVTAYTSCKIHPWH